MKKLATNKEAKVKFTAETSEFTKNITGINKTLGNLKSDLKLVDTEIRANGASFENLSNKQETLRTMTEQLNQKLQNQAQVLESAKQNFGENSDACNKAYRAYQATQGELIKLEAQLRGVDSQLEGMAQSMGQTATESKQAESALEKLESTISKQKTELSQLKTEYQNVVLEQGQASTEAQQLASKITALSGDLNKSETELKDVRDATNKLDASFEEAEQGASTFGDTLKAHLTGDAIMGGLENIADKLSGIKDMAIEFGKEVGNSQVTLQGATGATGAELEELEQTALNVYKGAYGESLNDVQSSMGIIIQQTELEGDALQKATEKGLLLSITIGIDVAESTQGAKQLV